MFEKYRNEADALRLSDEATDRILQTLDTPKKAARSLPIRPLIALAACVAVIVAAALTNLKKPSLSRYPEVEESPAIVVTLPAAHLTYAEVFALLEGLDTPLYGVEDMVPEMGMSGSTPTMSTQVSATIKDNTTTNTQYKDVDEADYVKAQNGYIYVLDNLQGQVTVYRADGAQTVAVATRTPADRESSELRNLYLTDDRLVVLYTHHDVIQAEVPTDAAGAPLKPEARSTTVSSDIYRYSYMKSQLYAVIYDITDPTAPRPLTEYGQDGYLVDSRMVDGVLYLVTNTSVYEMDKSDPATFVPLLYQDDTPSAVSEEALYAAVEPTAANYALVTAVAVEDAPTRLAERAVVGAGYATIWANTQHLILMQQETKNKTTDTPNEDGTISREYEDYLVTTLTQMDLADGSLTVRATATVDGTTDSAFALDEWNGHFRMAVTYTRYYGTNTLVMDEEEDFLNIVNYDHHEERFNRLYVLDADLNEVGRIDNLAPDETVQSVRFDGEIGYVVTFRQTDPLFAIDLSDPTNPTVLSALKITGFSEYLHPFGENRLFGFGYAGTEVGLNGRLKLAMFDITNKADVTVKAFAELSETHHASEALWDHHAVLVDDTRGIIGLPFATHGGQTYEVYRYTEEDGFALLTSAATADVPFMRGMFIDDNFYIVHTNGVAVYTADFTHLATAPPSV